jgi:Protein of unknown function (DUF3761)
MRIKQDIRLQPLVAIFAVCLLGASATLLGQTNTLTTGESKDHIGDQATVCGKVASTRYAATTRGRPTFLNLDKPYPNQAFTVLIWGENRAKFGAPENTYRDKTICVTGKITEYRGAPEMVISDPAQLSNSAGQPAESSTHSSSVPAGATAECRDGSYSFSHTRRGMCSHHGGVARWLR